MSTENLKQLFTFVQRFNSLPFHSREEILNAVYGSGCVSSIEANEFLGSLYADGPGVLDANVQEEANLLRDKTIEF